MAKGIPRDYRYAAPDRYELLKEFARKNRRNPTDAEAFLWEQLRRSRLGGRFRRQYVVGDYIADFICLEKKLIIEVDGGYHFQSEQMEEDRIRPELIKRFGFTIIRFTNDEVLFNTSATIDSIKQSLNT